MQLNNNDIKQLNDFASFLSFVPTWQAKKFFNCHHTTVALFTGNQCIAGDSKIYDPVLGKERIVQDIEEEFHVLSWDGQRLIIAEAEKPFRKEIDNLYTFKLSNGQEFVASLSHRVLTSQGYIRLSDIQVGCELFLPESNLESFQLVHPLNAQNCENIILSSQSCYQPYYHSSDGQLLPLEDSGLNVFPSQGDVPEHMEFQTSSYEDGQANKSKRNQIYQYNDHLPNLDVQLQNEGLDAETLLNNAYKHRKLFYQSFEVEDQPNYESYDQLQSNDEFAQSANHVYSTTAYNTSKDRLLVTSITYNRTDYKWDFTVPKYHNYMLAGVIHHNCMKTATTAYSYALRILGRHPVPKKNIVYFECEDRMKAKLDDAGEFKKEYLEKHETLDKATWIVSKTPQKCPYCGSNVIQHKRLSRVFRFCSETLPGEKDNSSDSGASAEVKNTVYPEFKKWLPPFLIKKDITIRKPVMTIRDVFGGQDILVEFVSYNQSVQSTAGSQRVSIWLDEQPPHDFLEEQRPRLLKEDGDFVISCTPADRLTYLYDEVFEKAEVYYRSKIISEKFNCKQIEKTNNKTSIAVIQAATDDNPTLSKEDIESLFESVDDPDVISIRRYGIFKQISGRIFKSFDYKTHFISKEKYFPETETNPYGIPKHWNHYRGIDYHEHVNWACGMMVISPQDEAFIYGEYNPSPENLVTHEIAEIFATLGANYKYKLNLIDPLANKKQVNTGMTTIEDLNRAFTALKREGIGHGAYWQSWDTKSTRGREEIRKRLKNAAMVGKPFNNEIVKDGKRMLLPTLWILDTCKISANSMKNWRLEEWAANSANFTKEKKETPQQKHSHFNMVWECLFKNPLCKAPVVSYHEHKRPEYNRFKGEYYAAV